MIEIARDRPRCRATAYGVTDKASVVSTEPTTHKNGPRGRAMPAVLSVGEVPLSAKRWKTLTRHIWSTQTSRGFRGVFDEKESGGRGTD